LKIAALCDRDTATGFRLAGIKNLYIPEGNLMNLWNEIKDLDDVAVLFITEEIAKDLGKYLKDFRIRNAVPIIVEIPDKKGHRKDHVDYVSHLIKKAVGIEVNRET
jgi:V/A-type H+-transporting ATPase subunit F